MLYSDKLQHFSEVPNNERTPFQTASKRMIKSLRQAFFVRERQEGLRQLFQSHF